jgi:hypothetical protein
MFGLSAVERSTAAAVAIIQPMWALVHAAGKQPTPAALRDPYILGFLVTLISFEAGVATGRMLSGSQGSGVVVLKAWPRITGDDASGIGRLMHDLAIARDPAFNEGTDNAVKLAQLIHGKPKLDDAAVASAIEPARRLPKDEVGLPDDNERGQFEARMGIPNSYYAGASALLWKSLFVDRLAD